MHHAWAVKLPDIRWESSSDSEAVGNSIVYWKILTCNESQIIVDVMLRKVDQHLLVVYYSQLRYMEYVMPTLYNGSDQLCKSPFMSKYRNAKILHADQRNLRERYDDFASRWVPELASAELTGPAITCTATMHRRIWHSARVLRASYYSWNVNLDRYSRVPAGEWYKLNANNLRARASKNGRAVI